MLPMLIVAAVLQSGSAAAADKPTPSPEAGAKVAQAPAVDPAKAFVCRTEEVTGTRFTKKVCRRKDEFAEKAHDEQLRLRQMQRPQYSCQMSHLGSC